VSVAEIHDILHDYRICDMHVKIVIYITDMSTKCNRFINVFREIQIYISFENTYMLMLKYIHVYIKIYIFMQWKT